MAPMNPTYAWLIVVHQPSSPNTKTAHVLAENVDDALEAARLLGVRVTAIADIERLFEVDVTVTRDGGFHILGSKWG